MSFESLKYFLVNFKGKTSIWGGPQDIISPIRLVLRIHALYGKDVRIFEPQDDDFKGRVILLIHKSKFPIVCINLNHSR